ncbi:hypothetical protein GBN28_10830 [Plesiomonas shigelloides]|nr:hypothetical protein GBN23_13750 [Plesiomonas shigelloides]KAB7687184.1 hypothetical protein GBN28_10830 [Plesiomonas shigelloides]
MLMGIHSLAAYLQLDVVWVYLLSPLNVSTHHVSTHGSPYFLFNAELQSQSVTSARVPYKYG